MRVAVSPKHKALVAPYTPRVANVIPHATRHSHNGTELLLIPHGLEETRLLRNMGVETPAPIVSQYDWDRFVEKPFESQVETAALLSMNKRAYVLNTMGTGKTRASLIAADYALSSALIHRVLIVAPLSTLTPTWMNEIFLNFGHRSGVVLHGTKKRRQKLLAEPHDFYIINHDGVQVVLPELLERRDIDCVILDELAVYRDYSTDRYKLTQKLLQGRKYVWGLTGAPTPNAPTDAYAQIRLLQPNKVGTFKRFRDSTMYQLTQYKWLPRKDAPETVHAMMQPSVRYTLEDCYDIPETTYTTRQIEMSAVQKAFYTRLKNAMATMYQEHEITAANKGVLHSKLLQVACGYIYTDERKVLGLQPTSKLKELLNILEETDRKVIVFVPYTHALRSVAAHLSNKTTVEVVDGSVSKTKRDRIFYEFQKADEPHCIVAHPRTMSHGLTLTASNTIVWFCPPDGLDTYIQANARIVRTGQKHKTNIIHLQATDIEKITYRRLQANESVQDSLLELFEGVDDTQ